MEASIFLAIRLPVFEAVLGQAARKQEANNKQCKAIDHHLLQECESVLDNLHTDLSSLMHVITKSVYLSQCSSLQTFIILLNHVDISKEYRQHSNIEMQKYTITECRAQEMLRQFAIKILKQQQLNCRTVVAVD